MEFEMHAHHGAYLTRVTNSVIWEGKLESGNLEGFHSFVQIVEPNSEL
jgi:hypothetical protein